METAEKLIGVCGVRIFDQNILNFIRTLQDMGWKRGYQTIAFSANAEDEEDTDEVIAENQLFDLLQYTDICALVILVSKFKNKKMLEKIVELGKKKKIPIFAVDGQIEGCYNLVMDYTQGFEQVVRHIVEEHHCTRINMVAGMRNNSFSDERVAIYKKVLQEHGIPFEEERLGYGDFWDRPTRKVMKSFLESSLPFPEAIVCANDAMALTVISVLNEQGMEVPEDVIVTGYDGIKNGEYFYPTLTTCKPVYTDVLERMLDEIERLQKGEPEPYQDTVFFQLQKGQSCGCKSKQFQNQNRIISQLFEDAGDSTWHNFAMNDMVTATLDKRSIMEVAQMLPEHQHLWCDHYRYACVKSELISSGEVPCAYGEMTTILEANQGKFREPGSCFDIKDMSAYIHNVFETEKDTQILLIRLLNSGKNVYGFIIEGFARLEDRRLQRCNEFAMFLSHAIHAVLYNYQMHKLNKSLARAYREIEGLSIRDSMTHMYNRRGFFQKLSMMVRPKKAGKRYLYIFSVDMDRLKYINDTFGHAEGDWAIIAVAQAMKRIAGEKSVCARFGGDEFVCACIEDAKRSYSAELFAGQLEECIRDMEKAEHKSYPITASVGMICEEVAEKMDVDALIKAADEGMYQQKIIQKMKYTQKEY